MLLPFSQSVLKLISRPIRKLVALRYRDDLMRMYTFESFHRLDLDDDHFSTIRSDAMMTMQKLAAIDNNGHHALCFLSISCPCSSSNTAGPCGKVAFEEPGPSARCTSSAQPIVLLTISSTSGVSGTGNPKVNTASPLFWASCTFVLLSCLRVPGGFRHPVPMSVPGECRHLDLCRRSITLDLPITIGPEDTGAGRCARRSMTARTGWP